MKIDFQEISASLFEELCFDLLDEMKFEKLILRKGGADSGRDIQGLKYISDKLIGRYHERWFFECKHYKNGVPPEALNSKIGWADAEQPDHLVFMISSYLSNNARTWLEKISKQKKYRVHVIEGKELIKHISSYPRIFRRYFLNEKQELMKNAIRGWIIHKIIPEPELIFRILGSDNIQMYNIEELAFLWNSVWFRQNDMDHFLDQDDYLNLEKLFKYLITNKTTKNLDNNFLNNCCWIDGEDETLETRETPTTRIYRIFAMELEYVLEDSSSNTCLYSVIKLNNNEAVEVLTNRDSNLSYSIRFLSGNLTQEINLILDALDLDDGYLSSGI